MVLPQRKSQAKCPRTDRSLPVHLSRVSKPSICPLSSASSRFCTIGFNVSCLCLYFLTVFEVDPSRRFPSTSTESLVLFRQVPDMSSRGFGERTNLRTKMAIASFDSFIRFRCPSFESSSHSPLFSLSRSSPIAVDG